VSRKTVTERKFMVATAVVWFMLSIVLPIINRPNVHIAGIPLLWFWVLIWVFVVPVLLTLAYYMLEVKP